MNNTYTPQFTQETRRSVINFLFMFRMTIFNDLRRINTEYSTKYPHRNDDLFTLFPLPNNDKDKLNNLLVGLTPLQSYDYLNEKLLFDLETLELECDLIGDQMEYVVGFKECVELLLENTKETMSLCQNSDWRLAYEYCGGTDYETGKEV